MVRFIVTTRVAGPTECLLLFPLPLHRKDYMCFDWFCNLTSPSEHQGPITNGKHLIFIEFHKSFLHLSISSICPKILYPLEPHLYRAWRIRFCRNRATNLHDPAPVGGHFPWCTHPGCCTDLSPSSELYACPMEQLSANQLPFWKSTPNKKEKIQKNEIAYFSWWWLYVLCYFMKHENSIRMKENLISFCTPLPTLASGNRC